MITRKRQHEVHTKQEPITYLPDHITDEAVELGKKARKIACVLGKAERREPGVGIVHTYEAPQFRVEVKRKHRNVFVFRTGGDEDRLVFAAYLDRPPHGLGASAKVYCIQTMQDMAHQIDAFHADAEREIANHQAASRNTGEPRRGNRRDDLSVALSEALKENKRLKRALSLAEEYFCPTDPPEAGGGPGPSDREVYEAIEKALWPDKEGESRRAGR